MPTPKNIIDEFQLDTSSNRDDFLVAADLADDHGLHAFAHFLRHHFDLLWARTDHNQPRPSSLSRGIGGLGQGRPLGAGYGYGEGFPFGWAQRDNSGHGDGGDGGEGYGSVIGGYNTPAGQGSGAGPGYGTCSNVRNQDGAGDGAGIGYGRAQTASFGKILFTVEPGEGSEPGEGVGGESYGKADRDGSGHSDGMEF